MNSDLRKYTILLASFALAIFYMVRLYVLQVQTDEYQLLAKENAIEKLHEYPLRGLVYDRNGNLIVSNQAIFDIQFVPRELKVKDTLKFCSIFGISPEYFRTVTLNAKEKRTRHLKHVLAKQLSKEQFLQLQDFLLDYQGLYVESRTIREYPFGSFASGLGYVREIDREMLESSSFNYDNYYQQRDIVGRSGIEQSYERFLRGKRGTRYIIRDARRNEKGSYENGVHDTLPEPGLNLVSTVDIDLQLLGERLMQNKKGSIVAIEPSTGEILSMISAPTFDPNLLTGNGSEVTKNFSKLLQDAHKPLYNRSLMADYSPGSTFKLVQALVALQDGVADSEHTSFSCSQEIVKCHSHGSPLKLGQAIQHSCNPFFLKLFYRIIKQNRSENDLEDTRIGLDRWNQHMKSFGFGDRLGVDLKNEKTGLIPSTAYYDKRYKKGHHGWKLSNIYSLSIGQGEVGVLPIQLANLAAILANRGHFYTPHVVKQVGDSLLSKSQEYGEKRYTSVDEKHFPFVIDAMEDVIVAGTARRAYISNIKICGKTGTVQNSHGEDHSVFIAFAPKEDPKIAIAVYVENSGFGGTWAAPIASLMIERYINGEIKRTELEEEIIKANLIQRQLDIFEAKRKNKDRGTHVKENEAQSEELITNADLPKIPFNAPIVLNRLTAQLQTTNSKEEKEEEGDQPDK